LISKEWPETLPSDCGATSSDNIVKLLGWRSRNQPDQHAYTFLKSGDVPEETLTWAELDQQVRCLAACLQAMDAEGKPVLLVLPQGLDYVRAFFACLCAGAIAVPIYPPVRKSQAERIRGVVRDAGARVIVSTTHFVEMIREEIGRSPEMTGLQWLEIDRSELPRASEWRAPEITPDRLALLQYTSGSVGAPKGVMVSHRNILSNEAMIASAFENDERTVVGGWLPFFHDMGLIYQILHPLYLGVPAYLMSPMAFLQKPVRWLRAISHYGITVTGAPNFAYDLCVREIAAEEKRSLDLSCWRVAFNGAEPVRSETLHRFAEAFRECGFHPEALHPCYGMAETTLIATGGRPYSLPVEYRVSPGALGEDRAVPADSEERKPVTLVGCGHTLPGETVRIVHPETRSTCALGEVGEIWIAGPHVALGYWNAPEATSETFHACTSDTGEGPFLRTGDLGFLREDGELFVTGRRKELIIIRGRNYLPADVEQTVERSCPELAANGVAAFSIPTEDGEALAIVAEVRKEAAREVDPAALARSVARAVLLQHELQAREIALIRRGTLPRTTSGKIQRQACKAQLCAGTLRLLGGAR